MGGRGASSGSGGGKPTLSEIRGLQKQLTSAKRAESVAERAYRSASGAEKMTPSNDKSLLAKRRTARNNAFSKWQEKKESRQSLEKKLDKKVKQFRRGR